MGREDVTAGKIKQARGKANSIIGAAKGDTSQEIRGQGAEGGWERRRRKWGVSHSRGEAATASIQLPARRKSRDR